MLLSRNHLPRAVLIGLGALAVVGLAAATPFALEWWKPREAGAAPAAAAAAPLSLVPGQADAFTVSPGVLHTLKVETAEVKKSFHSRPLRLSGSLNVDQNRMYRARSRFAGEVTETGTTPEGIGLPPSESIEVRPLRPYDRVEKRQLLAVVWSKDLGEKKSELVDALSTLRVDEKILKRLKKNQSFLPGTSLDMQQLKVTQDLNAVSRVKRTLHVWRLTRAEIEGIEKEAARIFDNLEKGVSVQETDWARVEIRAQFAGTILEKNVRVGDFVDTSTVLYTIADLSRLIIMVHAYEEDLPGLQALPPEQRRWAVQLPADPGAKPLPGAITYISDLIDPTQHTALVTGFVDNSSGLMRVGQYVTATVELPPPADEVEIPTAALIEDGSGSWVVVQTDAAKEQFALRRVAVARRTADWISLRTRLKPEEQRQGAQALRPGERVVTTGVLELASALKDLQGAEKK
jgi:cobalt-zinc-cadmium efflux system membrane fusion protein